jgi:hypothetical protein
MYPLKRSDSLRNLDRSLLEKALADENIWYYWKA